MGKVSHVRLICARHCGTVSGYGALRLHRSLVGTSEGFGFARESSRFGVDSREPSKLVEGAYAN